MRNIWIQKSEFPIGSTVRLKWPNKATFKVVRHELNIHSNGKLYMLIGLEQIEKDLNIGMCPRFSVFPHSLEKV